MIRLRWFFFWLLRILRRFASLLILIVPIVWLCFGAFDALLRRADVLLSQAAPIVSAELSRYLQRPIALQRLTPNLSVTSLYDIIVHPETYGTIPVEAFGIRIGNQPAEAVLARTQTLATVQKLTLYVSLTDLLQGQINTAIPRIVVQDGGATVFRDVSGQFNVTNILPKPDLKKPPQPPFRTVVEVNQAQITFLDYAAQLPPRNLPAVNQIFTPKTIVDLSGTRTLSVSVAARAVSRSTTAARLGGPVNVELTLRRDEPGELPDGPTPQTPYLLGQITVRDAALPYWLTYLAGPQRDFQLVAGRGDARVLLSVPPLPPRPDSTAFINNLSVSATANVRNVTATAANVPVGLERTTGTLDYRDGLLQFAAQTTILDERITASGTLWNLPVPAAGVRDSGSVSPQQQAPGRQNPTPSTARPPAPRPRFSVTVDAPRVPVARLLARFLPKGQQLPPELTIGGVASAQAQLAGIATGQVNDIVATGQISGLNAAWRGFPTLTNGTAEIALGNGRLRVFGVSARLGRGTVLGEGTLELRTPEAGGTAQTASSSPPLGNAAFTLRADNVSLAEIGVVQDTNRKADARFRLRGIGNLSLVGRYVGGRLTAAANVTTDGLSVGNIAVPVARARVLIEGNPQTEPLRIVVPAARLESRLGIARVSGNLGERGRLALNFAVASLDLTAVSAALGLNAVAPEDFPNGKPLGQDVPVTEAQLARTRTLGGTVSVIGTVVGTVEAPVVRITDLLGLNLCLNLPVTTNGTGQEPGANPNPTSTADNPAQVRRFALDTIVNSGIEITPERIRLISPLVLRRFPASVTVRGEVRDYLPRAGRGLDPAFDLSVLVEDLDVAEVQWQLEAKDPFRPATAVATTDQSTQETAEASEEGEATPPLLVRPAGRNAVGGTQTTGQPSPASSTLPQPGQRLRNRLASLPSFSASVETAVVRVQGRLSDPRVVGSVTLGNPDAENDSQTQAAILIGDYPIQGGSLTFDYNKQRTRISEAVIRASIGELRASATIGADGALSGSFLAPSLESERLSYLTRGLLGFDGDFRVAGEIRGTLERPVVTAEVTAPTFTLAGTEYADIAVTGLRFNGGTGANDGGELVLSRLALNRGQTQIALSDVSYQLGTGAVAGVLTIQNGDLSTILETVRRSGLDTTEQGASFLRTLGQLPRLDATFDVNRLAVQGRVTPQGFQNPQVELNLAARNIAIGTIRADTLSLVGTLNNQTVNVNELILVRNDDPVQGQAGVTIRGEGTYDPNGMVNAYLESNAASLDIIRSIPGLEGFPVRGTVDFSITASGTSQNPRVVASVLGRDLLIVTGQSQEQSVVAQAQAARQDNLTGFRLSLVRAEAELTKDSTGQYQVTVPDVTVTIANPAAPPTAPPIVEARINAQFPLSTETNGGSVAQRPITFNLNVTPVSLRDLSDYLSGKAPAETTTVAQGSPARQTATTDDSDIQGTVAANVSFGGSLQNPTLSGSLIVADARVRVRDNNGRDRITPIEDFDAILRLTGSRIIFDEFVVKLGERNRRGGNRGSLTVSGDIEVESLASLERILRRSAAEEERRRGRNQLAQDVPASATQGQYNLLATFNDFRPETINLLGLGEEFRGKVTGQLRVGNATQAGLTNSLGSPRFYTETGNPLILSNIDVRVPTEQIEPGPAKPAGFFNPAFDIALDISDRITVSNPGTFRVELRGTELARVAGTLFPPGQQTSTTPSFSLLTSLETVGGYFNLRTVRFAVQSDGSIAVRFGNVPNPGIVLQNVVAKGRVSTRRGVSPTATPTNEAITGNSDATNPVNRYDITVTLNGALPLFTDGSDSAGGRPLEPEFTSDPNLTREQILALIGGGSAAELAAEGRFGEAARGLFSQALSSAILPQYLSDITGNVAQTLGLDDLTVDYNFDSPLRVRFLKRLPDPFERFIVDYSRTFTQVNTSPTRQQPFTFNLSYELYQFRSSNKGILPRLQLGFSANEQNIVTYFLQGTISY